MNQRTVSLIVPCRNESAHIEAFCADALAQQLPPGWRLQLCIADGRSSDGTRERLQTLSAAEPRIRWIDNPARIVASGLNAALAQTEGEVVVRMDVHTRYAADYVAQCLAALAESRADNVGGPWHAEAAPGAGPMAQAVAAAARSAWVAGGAASRRLDFAGFTDTVYLGCWPRASFKRFGTFDEALVRNQDDEHNLRIKLGGGRIWQSPNIKSVYHPRGSLRAVFSQWLQYGYWKPFVIVKHRQPAALRHLVPAAFVALLVLTALCWLVGGPAWPLGVLLGSYALAAAALSAAVARSARLGAAAALCVPAVVAACHFGYGIGAWPGWFDALRGRAGRARFGTLTR